MRVLKIRFFLSRPLPLAQIERETGVSGLVSLCEKRALSSLWVSRRLSKPDCRITDMLLASTAVK
jgi:hypothetical protein